MAYPCKAGTGGAATCQDLPYPAPNSTAGRTCSCTLSSSTYKDDTLGCVDINACTYFPCTQNGAGGAATCGDKAGAASSTAGRTCTCSLSSSTYKDDISGCVDIDACTYFPCTQTGLGGAAACGDKAGAASSTAGRMCTCSLSTSAYKDDASGCVDIDACTYFPCTQTGPGGAAACGDTAAGFNSTAGRTCSCANGGVYSDATGCAIVGEQTDCVTQACLRLQGYPSLASSSRD